MAQNGTQSKRTRAIGIALRDLQHELRFGGYVPSSLRAAVDSLAAWVQANLHGVRRDSIALRASLLLAPPLHEALDGAADPALIARCATLESEAVFALRKQIRMTRDLAVEDINSPNAMDAACNVLMALLFFLKRVPQVRRTGRGLNNERTESEVARTRTTMTGNDYCAYCHQPSEIYSWTHTRIRDGLLCLAGPHGSSTSSQGGSIRAGLSAEFCSSHVGGGSNRWAKSGARNQDRTKTFLYWYGVMLDGAGLYRPHAERLQQYIAVVMSSRALKRTELPRLRAGHAHTRERTTELLGRLFGPLPISRDLLQMDKDLCEIAVSADGYLVRTKFDRTEEVYETSSDAELRAWRLAFANCRDFFLDFLFPGAGEAWITMPDPNPDPSSPFAELPVAEMSICHPAVDAFGRGIAVPRVGPAHRNLRRIAPPGGFHTIEAAGELRDVPSPILRVATVSPTWLSQLSLLKPRMSRTEP